MKEIGRIHTYEDFCRTYEKARKVGFSNINVDLMLALPNQKVEDLQESLEKIASLDPEHISVYSLIIEDGTFIEKQWEEGRIKLPSEEIERKMYWQTKSFLEDKGYIHYEISNFAKKGYESKHNINCWKQEEYIGIGAAAHSYIEDKRFSNAESIEKYIQDKMENRILQEEQSEEKKKKEYMMLGLRMLEGVSIFEFKRKFVENPIYLYRKELEKLVEEELIEIDLDSIKLTSKGLDFANLVSEEFV